MNFNLDLDFAQIIHQSQDPNPKEESFGPKEI